MARSYNMPLIKTSITASSFEAQREKLTGMMKNELFSSRLYDSMGELNAQRISEMMFQFQSHGYVHVINTGIETPENLLKIMPKIGFSKENQFIWGGRTSENWQKKWVAPGLRRMDYYPEQLYLLPNNEIQYQRFFPERILFFCHKFHLKHGGRTFAHSAKDVEYYLNSSQVGRRLIDKLKHYGVIIETGFIDQRHPEKNNNYFQSWQERFETNSMEEALHRCRMLGYEYDECWWKPETQKSIDGSLLYTLMTRITLPAFIKDPRNGEMYLRFPRIALNEPSFVNGYRRFPLGNNEELNDNEKQILLDAFLNTRQGIKWTEGDFMLLDNIRYGHSRESFKGHRSILIGMAGTVWIDQHATVLESNNIEKNNHYTAPIPKSCLSTEITDARYHLPLRQDMWREQFSMRVFDMQGKITLKKLAEAKREFDKYGILHIINTGGYPKENSDLYHQILDHLGFKEQEQFLWGGCNSGRTVRKSLAKFIRETDCYPNDRVLLAHNEILYQRFIPTRLLFWCIQPGTYLSGGRTFVHCAKELENLIRLSGKTGLNLLEKLRKHGFMIESGFLDRNHPLKGKNYFRSWQDRFDTQSKDEAFERCLKSKYQFDNCWWVKESGNKELHTLMTNIFVPAFIKDSTDGESYMLFPRIALDGPRLENGYRRFTLGNGEELNQKEIDILLDSFWKTRQGWHHSEGDILLVNNLRFGHSRESYEGPRIIGVSMAGLHWTDDVNENEWHYEL